MCVPLFALWGASGADAYGQATVGWDAVTGLGTPDFGKLKEIVLKV
jgi:hypothetical protein